MSQIIFHVPSFLLNILFNRAKRKDLIIHSRSIILKPPFSNSFIVDNLVTYMYTCQLARPRRESHACGLKTSSSRLRANFSRLTEKCEFLLSCLA